jgi:RimJ/RimL family protein N-acetyltransferase
VDLQLDRSWWGKGIGTRAIRLLTAHGFGHGADLIFAVDVASDNFGSQGAFQTNGYELWGQVEQPAGAKVPYRFDFLCHRGTFEALASASARARRASPRQPG